MLKLTGTRALVPAMMAVALTATACGGGAAEPSASAPSESVSAEPSAAASSGAPERDANADLVIWTDALKLKAVQAVAAKFGETNGIKVTVQAVSTDLQTNFVTANSAGNGPDVVVGAHDWIGNLVQNGAIDPLQLSPADLAGYSEKAVQATTYNDKLYGVPYGIEAITLYRNADVITEEPKTLDDAIAAGKAAVKAGKVESALNVPVGDTGDPYHTEPILTSMGGYIFAYDDTTGYDASDIGIGKAGSIRAAKKIAELSKEKVLRTSISSDNSIALFTGGKAAFLFSGPWALPDVKKAGFKYAIQPIPGFAGEKPAEPFMGAQAFMVASGAKNAAFAQEFVSTGVNNPEAMKTMFDLAALPPAMTSVQASVTDPDVKIFTDAANAAAPMPALPAMAAVWGPLGKAYAAIVAGSDPEKSITSAGKTITAEVKKQG